MNKPATVIMADYAAPAHRAAIPTLLDEYAQDPMGGGRALAEEVKVRLVDALASRPGAFTVLAYVGEEPVGLVNCFEGFSTFLALPLVNIHDVMVRMPFRGRGISTAMLRRVEQEAVARGACKLTLEVLSNNPVAMASYRRLGFSDYQLDPEAGSALFWEKKLI